VSVSSNKPPRLGEVSTPWEFQAAWIGDEQRIAPMENMGQLVAGDTNRRGISKLVHSSATIPFRCISILPCT